MYLKQICNLLSKKPQAMDVMLQFTSPARIVRPLCQFLDDWHYDSDQGEFLVKHEDT
jgi:mediator of RNA polymerase II transcription subunit 5